jgi:homoserine/homoserine lactone efflux protein
MSFHGWMVFAAFWVLFVTTPGPNAVNCIQNGMAHGFARALWGVAAILTQATMFLFLSAAGVAAALAAMPELFSAMKLAGAAVLIWLGIRAIRRAGQPVEAGYTHARTIYGRAFLIATINAKSVAGYLAAFTQFVQPDAPIWEQMVYIVPTALTITALSYTGYTAIGAGLGRAAVGAVMNAWIRRAMGACFIVYGALLGGSGLNGRPA